MRNSKFEKMLYSQFIVLAGIMVGLLFYPYMWEGDVLVKWAALITILSVVFLPTTYIIKQNEIKRQEKAERDRASGNLYLELDDGVKALDRKTYPDSAYSFTTSDGKEVFYVGRIMNHDFYDSMIFSGKINFLKPKLQQQIQDIFHLIKKHNEYLKLANNMNVDMDEPIKSSIKYYTWMDNTERGLLADIPKMQEKLKEDFDINYLMV